MIPSFSATCLISASKVLLNSTQAELYINIIRVIKLISTHESFPHQRQNTTKGGDVDRNNIDLKNTNHGSNKI